MHSPVYVPNGAGWADSRFSFCTGPSVNSSSTKIPGKEKQMTKRGESNSSFNPCLHGHCLQQPTAFQQDPGGSLTAHRTKTPSVSPPSTGFPKKSVKDNHSLHGTPGATGEGTEYTWTVDFGDTHNIETPTSPKGGECILKEKLFQSCILPTCRFFVLWQ